MRTALSRLFETTFPSLLVAACLFMAASSASGATQSKPMPQDEKMKWFNEARFGLFIHWGIYAVPAGEWEGRTDYGEWFQLSTKMPSYNKNDNNWKQPKQIVQNIADIASKGGNYLLNVGPTAEGVIPPESVRILKEVGEWMKVNGESIYGTTASPLDAAPLWGRVTQKGNTLYLHVFDWPADGMLTLSGLVTNVKQAHLLADSAKKPLRMEMATGTLRVTLPPQAPDSNDAVVVLEVEGAVRAAQSELQEPVMHLPKAPSKLVVKN